MPNSVKLWPVQLTAEMLVAADVIDFSEKSQAEVRIDLVMLALYVASELYSSLDLSAIVFAVAAAHFGSGVATSGQAIKQSGE